MTTLNELKDCISTLSETEKQELLNLLSSSLSHDDIKATIKEAKFVNGLYCVHCGCTENIVRNGTYKGKQRYFCRNCKKSFMDTTKSVLHSTKKPLETWEMYIG